MVLSLATAKTYVSRAMIKLGARDRAQLVVFAYQAGLVTPAPPPNDLVWLSPAADTHSLPSVALPTTGRRPNSTENCPTMRTEPADLSSRTGLTDHLTASKYSAICAVIPGHGCICDCSHSPLYRHHHRCKQAEGWRLEQPEPGVLVWHTPTGRSYTTTPAIYPV